MSEVSIKIMDALHATPKAGEPVLAWSSKGTPIIAYWVNDPVAGLHWVALDGDYMLGMVAKWAYLPKVEVKDEPH